MDWLKELLGEELFTQVAPKLGTRVLAVVEGEGADGSWIPKGKFSDLNTENKTLKTQLGERDTQLRDLQTAAKGNEELTTKIAAMEAANKETTEKHSAALLQARIDAAIDVALLKANALNPKAVRPFISTEGLELNADGSVKGLDDQLKTLTSGEDTKFLFKATGKFQGQQTLEGGAITLSGVNPWTPGKENLDEQGKVYKSDPVLAKKYMAEAGVSI